VSFIAAFLAGGVFLSAALALPPGAIFLAPPAGGPARRAGGRGPESLRAHRAGASPGGVEGIGRRRVLPNALAYVLGFSLVFVSLGVALGAAGALAATASVVSSNRDWLTRVGGALLIMLGLHQIGVVRIPFLERERRLAPSHLPA